ncbi:hypothetical protein [Nocardia grenadensis]|uniref:hypothetical protein n=1 Tax=Nocardia grenadensis TaxID=931537 RepID=UPI003D75EB98
MHQDAGDIGQRAGVADQLAVLQPAVVGVEVGADPHHGKQAVGDGTAERERLRAGLDGQHRFLPPRPRRGRLFPDISVRVREEPVVGGDDMLAANAADHESLVLLGKEP